MRLVVMTYPYHFHITRLAVKHALQHIHDIDSLIIIWDDTHGINLSEPIHRYFDRKYPNLIESASLKWSDFIPIIAPDFPVNCYIGQQLIKLHLDLLIQDDFIILDGDTIINQDIDPSSVMYSNRVDHRNSRFDHINYQLGIPNYEFWTNPFMYVKGEWLRSLREHIKIIHGHPIHKILDYSGTKTFPVFEWEIIARYVLQILKLPIKVEYFDKSVVKTQDFVKHFKLDYNFVLDGKDCLDKDFYKSHDIEIDEDLWNTIYPNQ